MAIFGAIAAATEKRRKKELLEELKVLGAVDEKSAIPAENIRKYPYDKHRIEGLTKEGKIRETNDGRYYLCEDKQ